jgi:nitrite reductase/ring-hydroxylating ferredoxin subunit
MADEPRRPGGGTDDPRRVLDVRIDTPGREGLTGTAPADRYTALQEADQITAAPDGRPMDEQPAWRTDFPIDWPQDQYVERRDFVKFLVLTSAAFTAGQFWIAALNWWRRRRGRPPIVGVAALSQIPVGGVLTFAYPGPENDCVLVRTAERAFVAYGQKCTHLSCAVRPQVEQGVIQCPCHNGYFDLASGRPLSGPPRRPLPLVRIEVQGGRVFATGIEERTA